MTEEDKQKIREIIAEEITKKLKLEFENFGYETMGLKISIEYDGQQLAYENL